MSVHRVQSFDVRCDAPDCGAHVAFVVGNEAAARELAAASGWGVACVRLPERLLGLIVAADYCPDHAPSGPELLDAAIARRVVEATIEVHADGD